MEDFPRQHGCFHANMVKPWLGWFWASPNFRKPNKQINVQTFTHDFEQYPTFLMKPSHVVLFNIHYVPLRIMLANQNSPMDLGTLGTLRWKPWSRSWLRMATNTLISSRCGNSGFWGRNWFETPRDSEKKKTILWSYDILWWWIFVAIVLWTNYPAMWGPLQL